MDESSKKQKGKNMRRLSASIWIMGTFLMIALSVYQSATMHSLFYSSLIINHGDAPWQQRQNKPRRPDEETFYDERTQRPLNVIILYPDDIRYDSLSSAGTQLVQTPFLDKLAQKGIRFTENAVTTSICWVSRATLFTGQYLARHGSHGLGNPRFYSAWNTSWPSLLQGAGYFVGHIGKWQYKNIDNFVQKHFNWTRLFEGQHWHNINGKQVHTTDHTVSSTIDFLRERPKDRNFAVTVAFYPPKGVGSSDLRHWNPKPESRDLYKDVDIPEPFAANFSWNLLPRKVFHDKNLGRETWKFSMSNSSLYQDNMKDMYRMINEVDRACQQIVQELKDQGVLNETLVIFTSDNGFLHGEHGLSGKWFPYAESIRVPLIVYDPRMPKSKRGALDEHFTLNIDLAPTILSAAGLKPPTGIMQGRDISDLYLKKKATFEAAVAEEDEASADDPWRKEFYYEHPTHSGEQKIPRSSALVRKDFKFMRYDNMNVEQLFDLRKDPMEFFDVLDNPVYAETLAEMRERYQELKAEAEKPVS